MSVTIKPLNSNRNSNPAHPNPTSAAPKPAPSPHATLKPAPHSAANSQPAQNPQPQPQPQPTIQYHSAAIGGLENARTKDYFAEQNQAAHAKKQARFTKVKWSLIISCGIAGVIAIGFGVWWIVARSANQPKVSETTPEEIKSTVTTTYNDAFDKAMDFPVNEENPTDIGPTNETIDSATAVYNQALADAAGNLQLTNELRLSQMSLYIMTGERYDEIVRIGSEINPDDLAVPERKKYYNYLAEAYWALGNHDESRRYYQLIRELPGAQEYGG